MPIEKTIGFERDGHLTEKIGVVVHNNKSVAKIVTGEEKEIDWRQ